ncbi:MAG: cbb3-type cytochrome c oxidase subunit I [Bacteroidales bacterium]
MGPQAYNGFFTIHGIIMIFIVVIPGLASLRIRQLFLPVLIGAKDVAFPKLNLFSFYSLYRQNILGVLSQFIGGGAPDTGWTFYVPYSAESSTSVIWAPHGNICTGFLFHTYRTQLYCHHPQDESPGHDMVQGCPFFRIWSSMPQHGYRC